MGMIDMNEETRRQKFYKDASKIVGDFIESYAPDDGSLAAFKSPFYDREALAKHHRAVWLNWARGQDNPPVGWLIDYHSQTDQHKEVQRLQAEELFAMGYIAATHDLCKQVGSSVIDPVHHRKATIQAFTQAEARLMIASLMKFLEHTMKKHNVMMSKELVDRLYRKLEILGDIKVSYVDYFVPADKEIATKLKAKWLKDNPKNRATNSKPTVGKRGLGSYIKAKK